MSKEAKKDAVVMAAEETTVVKESKQSKSKGDKKEEPANGLQKKPVYNFNEMYSALVDAHNSNNRRAIKADDISCDIAFFDDWKRQIHDLYNLAKTFNIYRDNESENATKARNAAMGKIYPLWKEILEAGEKEKNKKFLKVYPEEVADVLSFAWKFQNSANGTIRAIQGEQNFRKYIETLIGCKIAGAGFINDDKAEVISKYEGAKRSIANFEKKLDGYTTDSGEAVIGLKQLQKTAEGNIETFENLREAFPESSMAIFERQLAGMRAQRDDLDKEIKACTDGITDNKGTMAKLQEQYNTIMLTINLAK